MTQLTPISALPWPELTDIPNAQTAFNALATAADSLTQPRYATKTARDAAITSPADGQLAYRQDIHAPQYYHGGVSGYVSPGMVLIARQTLAADTATVTFSSIPQDFTHLHLKCLVRSTVAAGTDVFNMRLNSDSSALYDWTTTLWNDSTAPGTASTGSNGVVATSLRVSGEIDGATATAGFFTKAQIDIPHYSDGTTSRTKGFMSQAVLSGFTINLASGVYVPAAAAAITAVTFLCGANFKAGSVFSLYGVS